MQKYMALRLRPNHLITEGVWRYLRNPNYFGELLIYVGFSALALHWLPFVALAIFIGVIWLPFMLKKDRSLSRYPEFNQYKAKSKLLIPFIF
jgi:protein-S-isoprenylcysteine O-methyltransferase Ste14